MTHDDGNQHISSTEHDDRAKASSQLKMLIEPPRAAHPVDTGWAWMMVVGTFGVHFFSFGYIRSFGILFLEFQKIFCATSAETAAVSGVQFCAYSLTTLLVTNVILKRVSIRRCCIAGCVLQSLGIALNGIVPGIRYLIVTQGIIFGIGNALVYCPALIILSHYFSKKRALATVVATCGVSAGGITLPLLIRYLVDAYGLRGGLLLLAAVMLNQAVFSSLFTPISDYKFVSAEEEPLVNGSGPPLQDLSTQKHTPEPSELPTSENNIRNGEDLYAHDEALPHEDEASQLLKQHTFNNASTPSQPNPSTQKTELSSCNGEINQPEETENSKQKNQGKHSPLSSSPFSANYSSNQQGELFTIPENNLVPTSDRQANSDWTEDSEMGLLAETAMTEDSLDLLPGTARKPSLKETVLNVLSISSVDLYGSLSSIKHLDTSVQRDIRNDETTQEKQHNPKMSRRCRLPPVTKTVAFWAILFFFACGGTASGLPTVFMPPLATEKSLASISTIMLIVSALTELFGRLIPGLIIQAGWMRASTVLIVPLAACATLYQFTTYYNDYGSLLMMAAFSGIFSGGFWSTQSLVVIEMFGMERLGPMLGFYFLILGLSLGASHPIAGILRDVSGTYVATFHFFGAMYYIAVLMLLIITFINRGKSEKGEHIGNSENVEYKGNTENGKYIITGENGEHTGNSENNKYTRDDDRP